MTRHINVIKSSRFLRKDDVDPEFTFTILDVVEENVSMEGAPDEHKHVVHFDGEEKGFILNWTNAQLVSNALGTTDMDAWPGQRITLYHDPSVSYAGKLIGGIRAKSAPQQQSPALAGPNF